MNRCKPINRSNLLRATELKSNISTLISNTGFSLGNKLNDKYICFDRHLDKSVFDPDLA